jgi:hypothetical protein
MRIPLLTALVAIFALTNLPKANAQRFEFVENKGQWNSLVKFSGKTDAGAFYIQDAGYKVVLHQPDDARRIKEHFTGHTEGAGAIQQQATAPDNWVIRSHAYTVSFKGASAQAKVSNEPLKNTLNNYFIDNDTSKWASGCKVYNEVVYANIYPGIDVRYYTGGASIKYDFIVRPGADASKIVLDFKGVDGLSLNADKLVIGTSVGNVTEDKPYSYQEANGIQTTVTAAFEVTGNSVRFALGEYDRTQTLIIDPAIIFSSYVGSGSDNWGYCATPDSKGNLYAGGIVFGSSYPVSVGAYQTTYGGGGNTGENAGFDIAIFKFSADGKQRLYATYLGGTSGNELPSALMADAQDNLIVAGRSTSSNYPTTGSLIGPGGSWDIIVSKLSENGASLIGSRRIGGSANDGVNIKHTYEGTPGPSSLSRAYGDGARGEIAVDASGNIFVGSETQSNNFPATAGVFQPANSGNQDAQLLKFDATLSNLLFATCLGGSGDDAIYTMQLTTTGDLMVAGGTSSSNFPGDKAGTVGTVLGGNIDGFIAMVSSDGTQIKKSTFIGTAGIDQVYGIQTDRNGYIYILGTSTGSFPVVNATFSQTGGKQFIAKLQPGLDGYVYSTVFGSNNTLPNLNPSAFFVDGCENIFVAGWGGTVITTTPPYANAGTRGLTVTADAMQATTDGNDYYIFALAANATSQLYGSFFGQNDAAKISDHSDGGKSRFDNNGVLYLGICATCQGGPFPTSADVWASTNSSGRCNQAALKLSFNLTDCALPLPMLDFSGFYANDAAILYWHTTTDVDNTYFEVERSSDGVLFSSVGRVDASTGTNGRYQFTNNALLAGAVYYRVKKVCKDGQFVYTKIVRLESGKGKRKGLFVMPNPAKDVINIAYPEITAPQTKARIINSAGVVVREKILPLQSAATAIDVSNLANGLYYIYIQTAKGTEKLGFIKQ